MALTDKLTAIGDAIREKEGSTGLIPLNDMPSRIQALSSGGDDDPVRQSVLTAMNATTSDKYTFIVPAGAKKVPRYFFYGDEQLETIVWEDETLIKKFEQAAFNGARRLKMSRFPSGFTATDIPYTCFQGCDKLQLEEGLPEGIKEIGNYSFASCPLLQFTTLPSTVTYIYPYAFQWAFSRYNSAPDPMPPELFTIPASVKLVDNSSFYGVGLKKVRFLGTPDDIHNQAFYSSTITDIYVPWASDFTNTMTAKAPWGATGAQIHYNVSPDEVIA
jgi:hypothetical protein